MEKRFSFFSPFTHALHSVELVFYAFFRARFGDFEAQSESEAFLRIVQVRLLF